MINRFLRISLLGFILSSCLALSAFAQDCNGVYESGVTLLSQRSEAATREALKKFESAKRCYKVNRDETGVQNCDEKITLANRVLATFSAQSKKEAVSEEAYQFTAVGGTQLIPVKSRRSWNYSGGHDWCVATKEKEGLMLKVDANTSTTRRSQSITIEASGKKQLVKIAQDGCEEVLTLSEYDLYLLADDGEKSIVVTSNLEWSADQQDALWCTIRKDSAKLYIEPAVNDGQEKRYGTIHLTAGTRRADIRLTQDVDPFIIHKPNDNDTVLFGRAGGKLDLAIEYTVNKNSQAWEVESYPNWCVPTKKDDSTLQLKCESYKKGEDRTGVVRLKKGRRFFELPVMQVVNNKQFLKMFKKK